MDKYADGTLNNLIEGWGTWEFTDEKEVVTKSVGYYFIDILNELGQKGWELVMFDENNLEYILKKSIKYD